MTIWPSYWIDEKKIDVPVLVVAGSEDRIAPASVNRKIASKYRDFATCMEFPHHAHWIFGEPGWETVAGNMHFWLNQGEAGTFSRFYDDFYSDQVTQGLMNGECGQGFP